MSAHIRDRINRKLSNLSEERLYQVLDYVEFLDLRYGQPSPSSPPGNPLQRFADGLEDRLRAGGLAATTVSEAMGLLNKAVGVLGNVATAGRAVASDLANAAQKMGTAPDSSAEAGSGSPPPGAPAAVPSSASPSSGTPSAQDASASPSRPAGPPIRSATDPVDLPSYPSPS